MNEEHSLSIVSMVADGVRVPAWLTVQSIASWYQTHTYQQQPDSYLLVSFVVHVTHTIQNPTLRHVDQIFYFTVANFSISFSLVD